MSYHDKPKPMVTLLTGRQADTWSDDWRAECLERKPLVDRVLTMLGARNRTAREAYYAWIGTMYGPEQEKRVREAISRVWRLPGDVAKESAK